MSYFVESLEARTFLSVSPLVTTLHTDEAAVKSALAVRQKAAAGILKTIKTDLKGVSGGAAQEKALSSALSKLASGSSKANATATAKVNADVNKLDSDEAALAKKPGNVTLTAKVVADKVKLTADAAAELTAFKAAGSGIATLTALGNIITDGGTAATAASNAITTLSADSTTISAAANQAYATDVAAIVAA